MLCNNTHFSKLDVYHGKYVFGQLKHYAFNNSKDSLLFVSSLFSFGKGGGRESIKYMYLKRRFEHGLVALPSSGFERQQV